MQTSVTYSKYSIHSNKFQPSGLLIKNKTSSSAGKHPTEEDDDVCPRSGQEPESPFLVNFYLSGQRLALVTKRIQIAIQLIIAYHHTHTAIQAGKRLAKDTQVRIRL